jgi:hypothetical protein
MKFKDLKVGDMFKWRDTGYNRNCKFIKTEEIRVQHSTYPVRNCIWLNHPPGKLAVFRDYEIVKKIYPKYFKRKK